MADAQSRAGVRRNYCNAERPPLFARKPGAGGPHPRHGRDPGWSEPWNRTKVVLP